MFRVIAAAHLVVLHVEAAAKLENVHIEVMSEAGCEPCQYSIMHYFWPLFEQLKDVIEVNHHPFGNNYFATKSCGGNDGVYNASDRQCWAQRCVGTKDALVENPPKDCFAGAIVQQHGDPEAAVDRMESCAKSLASDWVEYWTFMYCMEKQYFDGVFEFGATGRDSVENVTLGCLNGTQLEMATLDACFHGTDGDDAVLREAKATFDHSGVPLVWVNGVSVDPPNYQHSVLLGAICDELKDPKPEVCSASTYPCWSDVHGGCKSSVLV